MKAHINGITVEGTPQEIMEYQRLQNNSKTKVEFPDFQPWFSIFPPHKQGSGTADVPYWLKHPFTTTCNLADE